MAQRPPGWDPINPTPRICVLCYGPAEYKAFTNYGPIYTCFQGRCKATTLHFSGLQYISDGNDILIDRRPKRKRG